MSSAVAPNRSDIASTAAASAESGTDPSLYGPVDCCPNCASTAIRPTTAAERSAFRCDECGIQWSYALGHLIVM